jgi:hypothetical protein
VAEDRGREVQTDLFFVEVQPFNRNFTQGQGSGGGGGGGGGGGAATNAIIEGAVGRAPMAINGTITNAATTAAWSNIVSGTVYHILLPILIDGSTTSPNMSRGTKSSYLTQSSHGSKTGDYPLRLAQYASVLESRTARPLRGAQSFN